MINFSVIIYTVKGPHILNVRCKAFDLFTWLRPKQTRKTRRIKKSTWCRLIVLQINVYLTWFPKEPKYKRFMFNLITCMLFSVIIDEAIQKCLCYICTEKHKIEQRKNIVVITLVDKVGQKNKNLGADKILQNKERKRCVQLTLELILNTAAWNGASILQIEILIKRSSMLLKWSY